MSPVVYTLRLGLQGGVTQWFRAVQSNSTAESTDWYQCGALNMNLNSLLQCWIKAAAEL